jgi:hypothetical protein
MAQDFARKGSFRSLIRTAIRQSRDVKPLQKLQLRLAMAFNAEVASAIEDHLVSVAQENGFVILQEEGSEPLFDLGNFEALLKLLIEYLPQLIAIFEKFFMSAADVAAMLPALLAAVVGLFR